MTRSSSAAGRAENGLNTPFGISMVSDGLGKPFSVCPAADDDLKCRNA